MTSALLKPTALACPPRFGTPRDLSRSTLGSAVAKVATRLGKPLMEWQRYVVDVALEIDPATGRFAYDEVNLTVPRQSGKTTLILSRATHRCSATTFFGPRQHVVYTAQTRKDARQKFVEEFIPDLEASPTFASRSTPHLGNGDEHIRFKNRSRFGVEATTEKSGHGPVLDEAFIDEAFAQLDNRVEDAVGPAMITRANKLLWVVSTAGWKDRSPYLLEKVTIGREHVLSGAPGRLAYFEWSAPEDADPEDESEWWRCMPALGITVPIEAIRSELAKAQRAGKLNQFQRPYLNQWVMKDAEAESVIDMAAWASLVDPMQQRPVPVAFGVEVSPDRRWTSISVGGIRSDGHRYVQVVKSGRGTGWVADELKRLQLDWKPVGVGLVGNGPAASLIPGLRAARIKNLVIVGPSDFAGACGSFTDSIDEGTVHHDGGASLRISLEVARKRKLGGAWIFDGPADGSSDIAPLRAAVAALYALAKNPKPNRPGGRRAVVLS